MNKYERHDFYAHAVDMDEAHKLDIQHFAYTCIQNLNFGYKAYICAVQAYLGYMCVHR